MWNVTYHAEVDAEHRMKDLARGFEARKHRRTAREANPPQANILLGTVAAGLSRGMEQSMNAIRVLFRSADEPSQQCC